MKIAITGSIACGKSTVCDHLRSLGFFVADADAISRELTAGSGDSPALSQIREAFGDAVFADGALDRAALAAVVFRGSDALARLNGILHPLILSEIRAQLSRHEEQGGIVFAEIPLLYECGLEGEFDRVWVVSAEEETQIARLKDRNGLTREQAMARIRAQMPLQEKASRASAVIRTDGSLAETQAQVDTLICALSAPKKSTKAIRRLKPAAKAPQNRFRRYWTALQGWLKAILIGSLSLILVCVSILVVQDYMARLEERRRLEAEAAEKARHPLYYSDLIHLYAQAQSLDPALVSAVILCESSFNPNAVSRLGARGLMQLMEDTAGWVAHKLREDDTYSFDALFDPETNIRYGTWYLRYLSDRFDGDPTKVICAYHAGQGNVSAWLRNEAYSPDGVTLAQIPTADTAAYCQRVLHARDVYVKYYFPTPTPEAAPTPSP